MIEVVGNIFDHQRPGKDWVCILTNGTLRKDGSLIMGAGIALEAARRWKWLPKALGECIKRNGLMIESFEGIRAIAFPTKDKVQEDSTLERIEQSCKELLGWMKDKGLFTSFAQDVRILIPRPGCGLGGLTWDQVEPVLKKYFPSDRFVIFSK